MSDINDVQPPYEAPVQTEAVQPSDGVPADGTGAPAQAAETAQQAEQSNRSRAQQARRNQESAFRRLAAEREEFKRAYMDLASRGQQAPQSAPATDSAPKREQFDTWEQYEDARADYRYNTRAKADKEQSAKELMTLLQRASQEQEEQALHGTHMQRTAEFARQVPDFEDVTDRDDVIVPKAAADAIRSMPNSPQLLYVIGKDPSLAARMHNMNAIQQAAFVGQISATLMQRPPQVSKAPAPGVPVGGRGGSLDGNPASMTPDQYYASQTKHHRKGK